jgi:hypothetical protein
MAYTQEGYPLMKEKEIMLFAGKWMNADCQVEQDKLHSNCMVLPIRGI